MKISINEAKTLLMLKEESPRTLSELPSKIIVKYLDEQGIVLKTKRVGVRGYKVEKGKHFDSYIKTRYRDDLEGFVSAKSRAELQLKIGDDKAKTINPQKGIYIYSDDDIDIGLKYPLCLTDGSCMFIHELTEITLKQNVIIVGVENFENLTNSSKLKYFVKHQSPVLFIFRNASFLRLISKVKNKVLYFPDFDIPGIRIFETEILKYNSDAKMIIPAKLKNIIEEHGNAVKYLEHKSGKYGNYQAKTTEGKEMIVLINNLKKIVPQEIFHALSFD